MPPRSREAVGSQGRARGWLAALQEEHRAAVKGLGARLQGLVEGTYSLSGLRLRPWIPFPRKNAVKRGFFSYFSFTGCWRFGDGGTWGCWGNAQGGRKCLAGHLCQGTLSCSLLSPRPLNLAF